MKIRTGKADVGTQTPAHTKGSSQGNEGPSESQKGHLANGRSTAERSTGVDPASSNPIDPSMPNLSPP